MVEDPACRPIPGILGSSIFAQINNVRINTYSRWAAGGPGGFHFIAFPRILPMDGKGKFQIKTSPT